MAISSKDGREHEFKWMTISRRLQGLGYHVKWEFSPYLTTHRYALFKLGEHKPMGIYDDEDTALAIVKMILTNARDEEP